MQCQCPKQPSLTNWSRAWLLDTGGDLLAHKGYTIKSQMTINEGLSQELRTTQGDSG